MTTLSVIKTNEFEYSRWAEDNVWEIVGKGNAFEKRNLKLKV